MYYADNLLDRFRHVDALAARGVGGERENAARILRDMETKYPGIRAQAYPRTPGNDAPNLDAFTAASGNFGGAGAEGAKRRPEPGAVPWEKWRTAASDALGWAARVAAEVAASRSVEAVVERLVEVQSKNLTSGNFQIAVKFPAQEMALHLNQMNEVQRALFVDQVTALFRQELTFAISPSEDEDEE